MTFIWYHLLWLLLIIPALVLVYIVIQRRRKKFALRYSNLSLVREALGPRPGIRRHIPAIILLIGITVAILAMARPAASVTLPSNQGTVILAIDVSGSMKADDMKPTRLDAAKNAARLFVEKQTDNVNIGVVSFSESASVVQSPTKDHEEILASINRLTTQRGTGIGKGLLTSLNTIFELSGVNPQLDTDIFGTDISGMAEATPRETSYDFAAIVLLSDGENNVEPAPLDVISSAVDNGIRIYTVGIGSEEGTVLRFNEYSIRVRLDEETLKSIASRTNGEYFKAGSEADLQKIYENLSTQLVFKPELTEITSFFTAFAILMILISVILSLIWFNRIF